MTLNSLGWDRFTPGRLAQLDRTIRQFAMSQLLSDPSKNNDNPDDMDPVLRQTPKRSTTR
jgi:hypothetical protein